MQTDSIKATIRAHNDDFRRNAGASQIPGQTVMTRGIADLPADDTWHIFSQIRRFDQFTEDNDPYSEHDFGSLDHKGEKIFWKIDYYADEKCDAESEEPHNPARCYRVLAVMLASEY